MIPFEEEYRVFGGITNDSKDLIVAAYDYKGQEVQVKVSQYVSEGGAEKNSIILMDTSGNQVFNNVTCNKISTVGGNINKALISDGSLLDIVQGKVILLDQLSPLSLSELRSKYPDEEQGFQVVCPNAGKVYELVDGMKNWVEYNISLVK